jgi:hypothetical protein
LCAVECDISSLAPEMQDQIFQRYRPLIEQYTVGSYVKDLIATYTNREYINKILRKYGVAFVYNIIHKDEVREAEIQKFNNTIITKFPIFTTPPISIGLYKGDFIKLGFLAVDIGIDYYFYHKLHEYISTLLFREITNNIDGFIELLLKTGDNFTSKDKNLRNLAQDELLDFIGRNFSITYLSLVKSYFLQHVVGYLIFTEISRVAKDYFLGHRDIKSFSIFLKRAFSPINVSVWDNFLWGRPISVSNLVEGLLLVSRPLTTGSSYLTNMFNSILESFNLRPAFLNDWWLLLLKEMLILLWSIKSLNMSLYQKSFMTYVKSHWNVIVPALKKYRMHVKNLTDNKKNDCSGQLLYEVEDEIKCFINEACCISFRYWLDQKNYIFSKKEFWVNTLLNVPSVAAQMCFECMYLNYQNTT